MYQWWVWAFIKYSIDTYDKLDNYHTKVYSDSIKGILRESFNDNNIFSDTYWNLDKDNIDVLLEWKWLCFEDINLLYKSWKNNTTVLFFQVKWWNGILLKNWKEDRRTALYGRERREHLFSNFLNNKNIYHVSDRSKFIVISNKYIDKNIINISEWTDRSLIINKIISEIRQNYNIKVAGRSIKKLERLIEDIYEWVEVKRKMHGATLPFKNQEDQEKIILFIKNTINIIKRTVILENFNINTIINKLYKELWEEKSDQIFKSVYQKSIDISTVKSSDKDFSKYIKYDDIFFIEGKNISDITEIREWKFL